MKAVFIYRRVSSRKRRKLGSIPRSIDRGRINLVMNVGLGESTAIMFKTVKATDYLVTILVGN